MSSERLSQVDEFIERRQLEHKVAGAVTLIARHGKLVSLKAHGFADVESKRVMRINNLFHLQSMTKPIATVAALQLIEANSLSSQIQSGSSCPRLLTCWSLSIALMQQEASISSRPHGP